MRRCIFGLSSIVAAVLISWFFYSQSSTLPALHLLPKLFIKSASNLSFSSHKPFLSSYVTNVADGTSTRTNSRSSNVIGLTTRRSNVIGLTTRSSNVIGLFSKSRNVIGPINRSNNLIDQRPVGQATPLIIYGATNLWQGQPWAGLLDLNRCKYKNCISLNTSSSTGIENADVVIFAAKMITQIPVLPWSVRQRQYWVLMNYESSAFPFNKLSSKHNNQFNATMLYRKDSTIYYPWGKTIREKTNLTTVDFAEGKSKTAFAYLSNCDSKDYDRKGLMVALSKYVPVDIYSGECKGVNFKQSPCPRLLKGSNPDCELRFNRPYRFFLAFENSLCKDYITEKLFDRLMSPGYFLPVAMGGLSIEEYTSIAPPDSFLHVDNFTSVKALGEYMKYLTENDEAYNKYHQWRYGYRITTSRGFGGCDLCKLANEKPAMSANPHIDQWFNDPSRCRTYNIH